jgi:hypothetical protein
MIRVSDEFIEAIRKASRFDQMSIAEFIDKFLLSITEKHYRDAVRKEASKIEENNNNAQD